MQMTDTCRCGAKLTITCFDEEDARQRHAAWLEAHYVCRQQSVRIQPTEVPKDQKTELPPVRTHLPSEMV